MSKINFIFLFIALFNTANATTHTVHVKNNAFIPAAFNVLPGDTVLWVHDEGMHTTTGTAVNIPAGAEAWDAPIDASNQSFQYVPKVDGQYFYFSKVDGDMSASFTVTGVLPVQVINFKISNTKNNDALISWSTASEQNTSYFSLQRSNDGIKFSEIARINAAGNSSSLQSYNYVDKNFNAGNVKYYYRLLIVDKDGRQTLSDVRIFKNNFIISQLTPALSPNPVCNNCNLNIQFNADKEETMFVQVYNEAGVLVKQSSLKTIEGLNNRQLHLQNLETGIYKILFKLHDITDTKTIVVQ